MWGDSQLFGKRKTFDLNNKMENGEKYYEKIFRLKLLLSS